MEPLAKKSISYFAFGSNLSSKRLLQRLPDAELGSVAILRGHRLCFRKNIRGESGKCDIALSDNPQDLVYGIVYLLNESEKRILDGYETGGFGYLDKSVEVFTLAGDALQAVTYYAATDHGMQPPFHWYKQHVLQGAIEQGFPGSYIDAIAAVTSVEDTDRARSKREMAIHQP